MDPRAICIQASILDQEEMLMLSEDGSTVQHSLLRINTLRLVVCRKASVFQIATLHFRPQLELLGLTCLLSAPSGGHGAGPITCSVEGSHADHVGGVTCQVLQLHTELWQE